MTAATASSVALGRRARARRRGVATGGLVAGVVIAFVLALMLGNTVYPLSDVVRVLTGETVPGASFTIGELRLPRAIEGVLAGAAFGLGGVAFQTLLRNPLASPDIIGISAGASLAAVIGAIVLDLSDAGVSLLAVAAALATAAAVMLLSYRGGVADSRLILIGIGVDAVLRAGVSYLLLQAAEYDLQAALRWLTGSLNNATWQEIGVLALAMVVAVPLLASQGRSLGLLVHGDDGAAALGVRVQRTRVLTVLAAVLLIAFGTAAGGPIAFVAFLAGPIAARIVGPGGSMLLPAALTGALLVLVADRAGEALFPDRFPVGVVTGALGAPFLLYLLVRANRTGGTL